MKLSDIPADRLDVLINQELPDIGDTACVTGPSLSQRRIALVSSAAIHLRCAQRFTPGASEYRVIPNDADMSDLVSSHPSTNFDRIGFQQDFNVVFPIERLRELAVEGIIESVADNHYVFSEATIPTEQEEKVAEVSELLHQDNVNGIVLFGVCPQCSRAVSGLAHYFERNGIPTVVLSPIKQHTQRMKSPRGLATSFELGRPYGAPNQPDLQRAVLLSALQLLERDDGPVLEAFPSTASPSDVRSKNWSPPVKLPNQGNLSEGIKTEIELLLPYYEKSVIQFSGRKIGGLTGLGITELSEFLVDYLKDPHVSNPLPDEDVTRTVKLCTDDLRHYYFQAALANEPGISSLQLGNWFWAETRAGELTFRLRNYFLSLEDEQLIKVGKLLLVPYNHYHRFLEDGVVRN